MDAGDLFLHKRAELERHVTATVDTEYNLIAASAILRHFLTDGLIATVIDLVGACPTFGYAEYMTFEEAQRILPPGIEAQARWLEFQPDLAPPHWPRRRLSLEKFIAKKVVAVRGRLFSVRDLIALAANAHGGVHHGHPRESLAELEIANGLMVIDGIPVTTNLLRGVGLNVLEGTQELVPLLRA